MDKQSNNAGILGFFISILSLSVFGLTSIISLVLCLIGIRRKRHRLLSIAGLLISLFGLSALSTATPPGFIPYPFSVVKYRMNAPGFWLSYEFFSIKEAQSRYLFFGGSAGALHYVSKDDKKFNIDDIVSVAQSNNWTLRGKTEIEGQRILKLIDSRSRLHLPELESYHDIYDPQTAMLEHQEDKQLVYMAKVVTLGMFPFWMQNDCIVLSFDVEGNMFPSTVIVSKDGSEMAVYYDAGR